jgi:hypothetical protein
MSTETLTGTTTLPEAAIASCGDVSCEFLIDPIPRPTPPPITISVKPKRRRVVMIDNWKPNSIEIFARAKKLLEERGVEVAPLRAKTRAGIPMAPELFDELATEEGLILCGVSDCGSCSASSSVDSVVLQSRGATALAVLTEPFKDQVDRAMSYQRADRELPVIVLPHPMQNVSEAELDERARILADMAEQFIDGTDG